MKTLEKSEKIIIRCRPILKELWEKFKHRYGFDSTDEDLLYLIHLHEDLAKKKIPIKIVETFNLLG